MAGRTLDQSTGSDLSNLSNQTKILLGIATIIITAFSIDLVSPHDFTAALFLNVIAVFLSSKLGAPRASFGVMAIITVLAIVGFYLKPESHTDISVPNRLATVSILWILAVFAYRRVMLENDRIDRLKAHEKEVLLRETFRDTRVGIQISTTEGKKLFANQALADLMGYETPEALLAMPSFSLAAPYERDRIRKHVSEINLKDPATIPVYEFDGTRTDGTIIRLQAVLHTIIWEGELAIRAAFMDISDRQRAQNALTESEQRYRDLIEQNPLGIQISDRAGTRLMVNQALVGMLGYGSTEEFLAQPARTHLPPGHKRSDISHRDLEESGNDFPDNREVNLVRKDGTILPVHIFRRLLIWNGQKAIQRTYIDISEQHRAKAALSESERRYRDLFEKSTLAVRLSDENGNKKVNQALVDLLGYNTVDELAAAPRLSVIAPHDRQRASTRAQIFANDRSLPPSLKLDLMRKDGSHIPVEVFWQKYEWGGTRTIQRTYIDLSERKRAERALIESEQRYRDLIEGSTLGVHITDRNEQRLFVNLTLAKMLGYASVDELMHVKKHGLLAPHAIENNRKLADAEAAGDDYVDTYDIDLLHKDGTHIPAEIHCRIIDWNGEKALQRFIVDISDRKKHEHALQERDRIVSALRQALMRASQISTMGEISSVIAHELHQPLTAIANTASAAQRHLKAKNGSMDTVQNEMLPLIAQQADRAGQVIGGIRKLFEGGKTERSLENFGSIVQEACDLATEESENNNLEIIHQNADSAVCSVVNKVQIQQVIYNLLRNAFDAVEEAPEKTIVVTTRQRDDATVQVSVRDNGAGVPPELIPTLFDPFVTTKEKGMGMGLYTCQQIVESHSGRIWAESEDGMGTAVIFTLPLTSAAEAYNRANN